jgi:hypothetical protein
VTGDDLPMLRISVSQDVLDEIVAILVAGDVDQRNTRTINASFAHTVQVAVEKLNTADLEALLNDL